MAFEKTISLKNCRYDYTLSPTVKKFTLKDNTFFETKVGVITNLENNKIKMKEIDKYGNFYKNSEIYLDEIQLLAVKNYKIMEGNHEEKFQIFYFIYFNIFV